MASFWALVPDVGYHPASNLKRRFASPSGDRKLIIRG